MSVPPSPGLGSEFSARLQPRPEPVLRRAMSLDETIFKDLDWAPQNINDRHQISTVLFLGREGDVHGQCPQTPTLPAEQIARDMPGIERPLSEVFSKGVTLLEISLARSSDDVFGDDTISERRNDTVVENGRVYRRVRAVESKLSQEDLARYGGKTAPGGVEWF